MSQVITVTNLAAYMDGQKLSQAIAQQVADAMNDWVDNTTGRSFGEFKTITERCDWSDLLYLTHQDVQSVSSLKIGFPGQQQTTLPTTAYWVNRIGRVTLYWQMVGRAFPGRSRFYNDYIEVTYVYGLRDVPEDLRLAVLGIAAGFYNWAINGQKELSSAGAGSYRLEYGAGRQNPNGNPIAQNVNEANWHIIESYRTRRQ